MPGPGRAAPGPGASSAVLQEPVHADRERQDRDERGAAGGGDLHPRGAHRPGDQDGSPGGEDGGEEVDRQPDRRRGAGVPASVPGVG